MDSGNTTAAEPVFSGGQENNEDIVAVVERLLAEAAQDKAHPMTPRVPRRRNDARA